MSPYIVTLGEVHDGRTVYRVGDELPDGVADAAIVASGVVEFVEPEPAKPPEPSNVLLRRDKSLKPKAVK